METEMRRSVWVLALLLCVAVVHVNCIVYSRDTGYWRPTSASTSTNGLPGSPISWSSTGNAVDSDFSTTYASTSNQLTTSSTSSWLVMTSWTNTSLTGWIPVSTYTLCGIEVEVGSGMISAGGSDRGYVSRIKIQSTTTGSNNVIKTNTADYGKTPAISFTTLGATTDPWTTNTWIASSIQSKQFSVSVTLGASSGSATGAIYYSRMRVTYNISTSISSISPTSAYGLAPTGTVTINGGQFTNLGSVVCRFGSQQTVGTINSNTRIFCPIPPVAQYGAVSVSISLDGSSFTTEAFTFTYLCNTTSVCNGHGTCGPTGTPCTCNSGWKGVSCDTPDCTSLNNCNGHGTCVAGPACSCVSQYIGTYCNISTCYGVQNCSGHGTCVSVDTCVCNSGYYGLNCATANCSALNNCNVQINAGICISPNLCQCNTSAGYSGASCTATCTPSCNSNQICSAPNTCSCPAGYIMPYCNTTYACTNVNNCNGNGVCVAQDTCQCTSGYLPPYCALPDCRPLSNCNGNGNCTGPYKCTCATGWSGSDCSIPNCSSVNNCNIVNGGGTCVAPGNCSCLSGWSGSDCSTPVCSSGCPNGVCDAPEVCSCLPGYLPPNCDLAPPDCSGLNGCSGHGTCIANNNCTCDSGYLPYDCSVPDCSNVGDCSGQGICIAPDLCNCFGTFFGTNCSETAVFNNNTDITTSSGVVPDPIIVQGSSAKSNVMIIAVLVSVIGFVAIVAAIVFAGLFVKRYRKKKKFKFVEPAYSPIVFGKLVNSQYEYVGSDSSLQGLKDLLLAPGFEVLSSVVLTTAATDKDNVARAVVHFLAAEKKSIAFLTKMVETEVGNQTSENTLFRSNSMTTALFQVFSKIYGIRYLWDQMGTILTELLVVSQESGKESGKSSQNQQLSLIKTDFDVEVDPTRLEDSEVIALNKYTLLLVTQKVFTAICHPDKVPAPLKAVLQHVGQQVPKKFPGYKHKAIGGFMFLRFIVPSITAPHIYGLYTQPPDDNTQRKLVLLSKVLQNLANEVPFGSKEQHMAHLNDFIQQNLPALRKFFDDISQPISESADLECEPIPDMVQRNALLYLASYIAQNHNKIVADLSSGDPQLVAKLHVALKEIQPLPVAKRD